MDGARKWIDISNNLRQTIPEDLLIDKAYAETTFTITNKGIYIYEPDFHKSLVSSSNKATARSQGHKLLRIANIASTDELWTTYESGGAVYAVHSTDLGQTWSRKMALGEGYHPAIAYNDQAVVNPAPGVVWWAQNERDTIYFAKYISGDDWTTPVAIVVSAPIVDLGPPSFVIGSDNIGHIVYASGGTVYYTQFSINTPGQSTQENVGTGSRPCIGFMSPGLNPEIHVVWENNTTVYYRSRTSSGTWSLTETIFSNAENPSLTVDGSNVYVTWETNRDIYWRYAVYSGGFHSWTRYQRICLTADPSSYPVLSGGYTCAWVEEQPAGHEVYLSRYDPLYGQWTTPINISNGVNDRYSHYPHITHKQTSVGTSIYFIWTEGSVDLPPPTAPPYEVRFKTYTPFGSDRGEGIEALPFYVAEAGEEEISLYTLHRDGYVHHGSEPYQHIDYGVEYLEYRFEMLDPARGYAASVYLYQRGSTGVPLTITADGYQIGFLNLPSDTLIILSHTLPEMLFADSTIQVKVFGSDAVASILVLYEYEYENEGGGPQSQPTNPVKNPPMTLRVQPNPVHKVMDIHYTVSEETNVTVTLYDVSGRVVENVSAGMHCSGVYHHFYDMKDLAQGGVLR